MVDITCIHTFKYIKCVRLRRIFLMIINFVYFHNLQTTSCLFLKFTCEDCGKSFTRQSNLHRHRRTTHHVDTISCSTCGGRFNRRDNYLRHTRNHIRIPDQGSRPIVGSELLTDSQIHESIQKENVCPSFQNQVGSGVPPNDPQGKYLTFLVFFYAYQTALTYF